MANTSKRKARYLKALSTSRPAPAVKVRLPKAMRQTAFKESRKPFHASKIES